MRSTRSQWVWAMVTGLTLGCSGGTNPVELVGTQHGEDPGPKGGATDLEVVVPKEPSPVVGTMTALCAQACSHRRAADCSSDPAYKAKNCQSECAATQSSPECDDELAAYYHCVLDQTVTCSHAGVPIVNCDGEQNSYNNCETPSSGQYPGCVPLTSSDTVCLQFSTSLHYYQCTSSSSPSASCSPVAYTTGAFCCP